MKKNRTHYYYLNSFRVIAAFCVLLCHARCELFAPYSHLIPESQNIFTQAFFLSVSFGQDSVVCFFLLSGFLVGGINTKRLTGVLTEGDSSKVSGILRKFSTGRFVRIYPPLIASIIFITFVRYLRGEDISIYEIFGNLLGLQGVSVHDYGWCFWTLAYEIWFYVLIASIISLFSNRNCFRITGGILLIVTGCIFMKLQPFWIFTLLLGVLFYYLKDYHLPSSTKWIALIIMMISTSIGHLSSETRVFDNPFIEYINGDMTKWVFAVSLGFLMLYCVQRVPQKKWHVKIENIGNKIAPMTYCLYITHFAVLRLVRVIMGNQMCEINCRTMLVYLLVCALCILFGYVFYFLFEKKPSDFFFSRIKK